MSIRLARADYEAADMIAEADRQAAETAADVEALERAVAAGDTRVTPAQIAKARDAAGHAGLAQQGARVRADDHKLTAARAELGVIVSELEASGKAEISAAREHVSEVLEAAQGALAALADAVERHDGLIAPWHARLSEVAARLDRADNPGNDVRRHSAHEREVAGFRFGAGKLAAGDWHAEPVGVTTAVATALAAVRDRLKGDLRNGLGTTPGMKAADHG